jgi:hypothetical protein
VPKLIDCALVSISYNLLCPEDRAVCLWQVGKGPINGDLMNGLKYDATDTDVFRRPI